MKTSTGAYIASVFMCGIFGNLLGRLHDADIITLTGVFLYLFMYFIAYAFVMKGIFK